MSNVALIGIDLGKHCFHLHGQDEEGRMKSYFKHEHVTRQPTRPPRDKPRSAAIKE